MAGHDRGRRSEPTPSTRETGSGRLATGPEPSASPLGDARPSPWRRGRASPRSRGGMRLGAPRPPLVRGRPTTSGKPAAGPLHSGQRPPRGQRPSLRQPSPSPPSRHRGSPRLAPPEAWQQTTWMARLRRVQGDQAWTKRHRAHRCAWAPEHRAHQRARKARPDDQYHAETLGLGWYPRAQAPSALVDDRRALHRHRALRRW